MKDTLKKWLEKKGAEKWFQRDNLIILVLSGILLFIIALPTKEDREKGEAAGENRIQTENAGTNTQAGGQENMQADGISELELSGEDYCTYLEKKLAEVLSGMSGVGRVKVMITLKSSEELVVEKDTPVSRSGTSEQDSQGGSRITNQSDTSESTVYRTKEGESEPYVVKTILPEVEGVVIVAGGAGTGVINKNITEIVQALFDVEAHKIKVVKMEAGN